MHAPHMFIAAAFTVAKTWTQPECPLMGERVNSGILLSQEKYSIMPVSATCMGPEIIILSEVSQK